MLSLTGIAKHYGERTLFSGVNLTFGVCERVGLVGPNGCGKSTLLDILAGRLEPDEGSVSRNRRATVGLLQQEVPKYTGRTLLEEMLAGHASLNHLEQRLALLEEEMRQTEDRAQLETLAAEHGELERRFDEGGGYDLPAAARRILGGLAFRDSDFARPTAEFSGGWLMRLGLARLLLTEPDLLLLDEPTNYLDLESVVWLESYLRGYDGSIVIASHDRVLLNRLATRVLEIDARRVVSYAGNYDAYLRARALREEGLRATQKAQEREIAHAQAFIERFRAKNTKARQVQSRIKRLEKMDRVEAPKERRTLRLAFPEPPPSGRVQIALTGVWKGYGGPPVYQGVDLTLERGERLVLVGPNGAGKSTLLKLLAGVLAPDRGERRLDPRTSIAYYAQHQVEALDFGLTVLEEVQAAAPDLVPERIRGLLGRFLFSGDDVKKAVGVLSGGEKARVVLAKLLVRPPNVILLDEPTSHLDIPSREALEGALEEYPGSLVMISHDRHFIDRLASRVVEVGGGGLRSYLGGYGAYLEKKAREAEAGRAAEAAAPSRAEPGLAAAGADAAAARGRRTREDKRREADLRNERHRRLAPLKRELEALEREIEELGRAVQGLETEMADPDFYRDGARFAQTFRRHRELRAEGDAKLERWQDLSQRLEQMERELAAES
jgi:ATP-binding cassette subfamily F protein 3